MKTYAIISDLHGVLPEIQNNVDALLICGDICPLSFDRDYYMCDFWLKNDFTQYIKKLNCEKVIIIPGNHDFIFWYAYKKISTNSKVIQEYLFGNELNDKLTLLIDDYIIYDNKKIYGTPWCPELKNWAFYGFSAMLDNKFSLIPEDTNILLTHCPPKNEDSGIVLQKCKNQNRDFGCQELTNAISKLNIDYVFCGHIHSGNHNVTYLNNTEIYNVSILDEFYYETYKPLIYLI